MVSYVSQYKAVRVEIHTQYTGTQSAATRLLYRWRYRPSAFFSHPVSLRFHSPRGTFSVHVNNYLLVFLKKIRMYEVAKL
jgi:hypothetical protein